MSNPNWIPKDNESIRAGHNDKVTELEQSSLLSFPIPDFFSFEQLTFTVAANNSFLTVPRWDDAFLIGAFWQRIKHVIYVIKENRTYDQVLGDLDRGNGDPALTEFGAAITPNSHRLAAQFCDLDNFFDSGDVVHGSFFVDEELVRSVISKKYIDGFKRGLDARRE